MKKYLIIMVFIFPLMFAMSCKHEDNAIYSKVDQAAEFPGGLDKFYDFLSATVVYPAYERENNIQGKVLIAFVVEKDGSLGHIEIVKGVSRHINNESIRVLKLSPKWKPAINDHNPVRTQYTVPLNFILEED